MKSKFEVFAKILRDPNISHGAFRLWHAIRDYQGKNQIAFPGQRALQNDLHCSMGSIKGWIRELVDHGYLEANIQSGCVTVYKIKGGNARKPPPKVDALAVSKTGNAVFPKLETLGVSKTGNESKPIEVIPISKAPVRAVSPVQAEPERMIKIDFQSLVMATANKLTVSARQAPTQAEVEKFLSGPRGFTGAARYAGRFVKAMARSGWRYNTGGTILDWRPVARRYASACERRARLTPPKNSKESFF